MDLKDKFHNLQDKWDAFLANKFYTHGACAVAGVVIGIFLAYR